MLAWYLWACVPSGGVDDSASPGVSLQPPVFSAWGWSCSAEEDSWLFEAEATAWTSGADLSLSLDGTYIEEHSLASVESAAEGGWDRLALTLEIVADPRDQARNSTTAMLCDTATRESLGLRVALLTPDTQAEADCRVDGAELDWSALGYGPCETRWESD